ncbi:MAG: PKD domain-containing protein [Bacteroidetes bacterium]|nr:PKD domain-containing protein [Bacteroidota bacterium]
MKNVLFYILIFMAMGQKLHSTHIVGGEIFYDRINDSTYKVTLKLYRDCFNGLAPFPGTYGNTAFTPAILTVYNTDSLLVDTFDIGAPIITQVPPSINNPCIHPPGGICVEQGVYTYTLTLPPKPGGYYLVFQVAFRNNSVLNLLNSGTQGATYYTFIPGPEVAAINSSPRYTAFPPIFICNKVTFTFNHKATDPDADQLVYSLCAPYDGVPNGGPSPPPPYPNVSYVAPYNGTYPIPSAPAFSINSVTGVLTGSPNTVGQYVVGVCVQEFKGNTLLNTHFRDFQFNVVPCIVNVVSAIAEPKSQCQGTTITFTNSSQSNIGNLSFHWDFGVPQLSNDTSNVQSPSYTYQDTGKYLVTLIANPGKPCSDTITKLIYVYPQLKINFPPVSKQCFKGNAFSFSAQGAYVPSATFNWNFSAAATPSTSTIKNPGPIFFNQPGKYFVKLIAKQFTCVDSFIDSVRVVAPPVAKINNLPVTLCDPATVAFSNGSTSDLPVNYHWFFSNGATSSAFQPVQVFSPAGVYSATLIVITKSVCIDTSLFSINNITVTPTPKAGFIFSPQSTTIFDPDIQFTNTASSDVIAWQYTFGDGSSGNNASTIHTYLDYGDFPVMQVVNNPYCSDTLKAVVKILPEFRFWIPNTFTPDNDLLNDVFQPTAIGTINYQFFIFTRWGEKIFSTNDPKQGWNGLYKGKECQDDAYVWRISFKNVVSSKEEIHYGHIMLLRK